MRMGDGDVGHGSGYLLRQRRLLVHWSEQSPLGTSRQPKVAHLGMTATPANGRSLGRSGHNSHYLRRSRRGELATTRQQKSPPPNTVHSCDADGFHGTQAV